MAAVYCALVHHPVRDRAGDTVTTAVTNLDVHDIARTCRTFGVAGYFVVTPIEAQRVLVDRILDHWRTGPGARRTPERTVALALCRPIASVEDAMRAIEEAEGSAPWTIATGARPPEGRAVISFGDARRRLAENERPALVVFGTGHGLARQLVESCDDVLEPIRGRAEYNHLSVRAAAAIIFDRVLGHR